MIPCTKIITFSLHFALFRVMSRTIQAIDIILNFFEEEEVEER